MRILFDIGHPKDVNIFKGVIPLLQNKGHEVKIYARVKENTRKLLEDYGFDYGLGKYYHTMAGKGFGILTNDIHLYNICKGFKPDLFVSPGSPYAAHVSKLMGKKHISFPDTEIAGLVSKIALPFTDKVYTSTSFYIDYGKKHERYNGYLELTYLHPNYFKPNKQTLERYGLEGDYIILRLSALASHHDINAKGFSFSEENELQNFILKLEYYGKVIIFSEKSDWKVIQNHQLDINPRDFHDILFHAKMCIGEGATMASEAAILGVPSLYVSNTERGYLNELEEKYGLVFNISDRDVALHKAIDLLNNQNTSVVWRQKRELMLSEKIDVTQYIVRTIEKNLLV